MAQRVVTVVLTPGTPRHGLWCPRCALPSAVEVDVWMLTRQGLRLMCTVRRCVEADHGDR